MPDRAHDVDNEKWVSQGGKWIVFDSMDRILELGERLAPYISSGEVHGAKYWNGDPSAICVYSLDTGRDRTLELLRELGAGEKRVWEYDYAWDRNIGSPCSFLYSQTSKLRTILQSYGIAGSARLFLEVFGSGVERTAGKGVENEQKRN